MDTLTAATPGSTSGFRAHQARGDTQGNRRELRQKEHGGGQGFCRDRSINSHHYRVAIFCQVTDERGFDDCFDLWRVDLFLLCVLLSARAKVRHFVRSRELLFRTALQIANVPETDHMTWLILPAVVNAEYRPSGLAVFATCVAIVSVVTTAHAYGLLDRLARRSRRAKLARAQILADAQIDVDVEKKSFSVQGVPLPEDVARGLLSKVLEMPLLGCLTDSITREMVQDALDLLRFFENEQKNGGRR
jgi:hypothetical protein